MPKRMMRLGHSPDPDDAFMFYGIASGHVSSDLIEFEHVIEDIQTLNTRALRGELEMTAISSHAYLSVMDDYRILSCGASMGEGYGPIVVAAQERRDPLETLGGLRVAVPGRLTTAFLLLSIYSDGFEPVEIPFDRIMDAVGEGSVDAGLLIHEGQLTYEQQGLHKVLDLGALWAEETDLPMPLGVNVVRRDLSPELQREVLRVHRESIDYGLEHKDDALSYALRYGRGLDADLGERFVLMYVNELTRDMGETGRAAHEHLYRRAHARGLIASEPALDILSD